MAEVTLDLESRIWVVVMTQGRRPPVTSTARETAFEKIRARVAGTKQAAQKLKA
jgi:hypothetical protein